ncbi:hypothetical protein [Candidatus Korobacter versatilis]|nr:hypothetical protein [Candidatus Koribacter versatilis]
MRITRISDNLRAIQNEISMLAGENLSSPSNDEPLAIHDLQALQKVKWSVDQLRQVLRTCIEFAHAHVETPASQALHNARVEKATLMLQFACQGLQLRERPDHEVPSSLFEQLTQMAIATVDRHWQIASADTSRSRLASAGAAN